MSDALKVLEEIEARLDAAPKGPWKWTDDGLHATSYPFPKTNDGMWLIGSDCNNCSVPDDTTYYPIDPPAGELIAHAPEDLALLARLVRCVAEADCDWEADAREGDCSGEPSCWPCRIRLQLGGVR